MASNSIKIRAKASGDSTEVKALIKHEMETGLAKDKAGNKIPALYIREVKCEHNGKTVMTADWGIAISKNPYLSFRFSGAKVGDKITVSWVDSSGDTDSASDDVK